MASPKLGDLLDQLKASVEATKKRREEALAGTKEGRLVAVEGGKGRKARSQADEADEADEKASAHSSRRTRAKAEDREAVAAPARRRKSA